MAQWVEQRIVFEGSILTVKSGRVLTASGASIAFDVVEHGGGVAVVAVVDGCVVLVKQPRVAVGQELLELPAGKLEGREDEAQRARAELEEETGYRAGRLERALEFFVSPGYATERIVIYLAFDLEEVGARPEATEDIQIMRLPVAEARRMLSAGEFRDAKTIIGLRELFARLGT